MGVDIILILSTSLICLFIEYIKFKGVWSSSHHVYPYYTWLIRDNSEKRRKKLNRKLLELKEEINGLDNKQEFSKWAKTRRRHDKVQSEIDEIKKKQGYAITTFQAVFSIVAYIVMYLTMFLWAILFRSSPAFTLPYGWFGPLESYLSYPTGQLGTLSILLWLVVCQKLSKKLINPSNTQSSGSGFNLTELTSKLMEMRNLNQQIRQ